MIKTIDMDLLSLLCVRLVTIMIEEESKQRLYCCKRLKHPTMEDAGDDEGTINRGKASEAFATCDLFLNISLVYQLAAA